MLNNLYKRNRFKVAFIALNLGGLARRTWPARLTKTNPPASCETIRRAGEAGGREPCNSTLVFEFSLTHVRESIEKTELISPSRKIKL